MNEDSSRPDADASLFDVFRIIVGRWYIVAGFTLCVMIGAALYYGRGEGSSQAEMLLYDTKYAIRFTSHTRALSDHWHHMQLGEAPEFLQRVAARMHEVGMMDELPLPEEVARMFVLQDDRGRSGPVVVTAIQPLPDGAVRALEIWAEEYIRMAPMYRARQLLFDLRNEQMEWEEKQREMAAVSEGLSRLIQEADAQGDDAKLYAEALRSRRVALEVDRLAMAFREAFREEVSGYLAEIAAGEFVEHAEDTTEESEAWSSARLMMESGRDELFSAPVLLDHPAQKPAKVFSLTLTALLLSSTGVVFYEWLCQGKKARGGVAG